MTLTASVMMIGGTPNKRDAEPVHHADQRARGEQQRDDPEERGVLAAGEQRDEHGGAVQHPRHGQIDAAADDDEGLPDRDDADEGGEHGDRAQMSGRQEAGREQAGQEEQRDHAEIGEQDGAVAYEQRPQSGPAAPICRRSSWQAPP